MHSEPPVRMVMLSSQMHSQSQSWDECFSVVVILEQLGCLSTVCGGRAATGPGPMLLLGMGVWALEAPIEAAFTRASQQ